MKGFGESTHKSLVLAQSPSLVRPSGQTAAGRPDRETGVRGDGSGDTVRVTDPAGRLDLGLLYREHGDAVARWVLRLAGPSFTRADVQDAVQEVFAVAAERMSSFRGDSKRTTWLYGIAENVVRAERRRRRVRRWFLGAEREEPSLPAPLAPDLLAQQQAQALVYRALDRLGEPYRSALILFEIEELSGQRIAELKGVKLTTVWVWLHRARGHFLRELESLGPEARP